MAGLLLSGLILPHQTTTRRHIRTIYSNQFAFEAFGVYRVPSKNKRASKRLNDPLEAIFFHPVFKPSSISSSRRFTPFNPPVAATAKQQFNGLNAYWQKLVIFGENLGYSNMDCQDNPVFL